MPSDALRFAMFTPEGDQSLARLLAALAERRTHADEPSLLRWWRVRVALLGLEHPEVHDTAVREELQAHLLSLGLPDTFLQQAVVYAPASEVLFGLPALSHHLPGETLQEMHERLHPSQGEQDSDTTSTEPAE